MTAIALGLRTTQNMPQFPTGFQGAALSTFGNPGNFGNFRPQFSVPGQPAAGFPTSQTPSRGQEVRRRRKVAVLATSDRQNGRRETFGDFWEWHKHDFADYPSEGSNFTC
uniref:Uncharacterized protein n=1 Tax=Lutzomyia longipalpis TaxID=7200 RepID=A0A1B0CCJ4_LUTLO